MSHARTGCPLTRASLAAALCWLAASSPAAEPRQASIIHMVQEASERLELTVNTSRILTLDQKIPRVQVNNPELLEVTPLSAKQIQVFAKKMGITQINLWNEQGQIHSIDVTVLGDVRELAQQIKQQFPSSAVIVTPTAQSVLLRGYVDNASHVGTIVDMAKDYSPKVINNINVAGAQQVLLHVRVMEVSRTNLRQLGFDFGNVSGNGDFISSSISGMLSSVSATSVTTTGADTLAFGIIGDNNSFFGLLNAMHRNQLMKVTAEPTLITVSGRPASFLAGGEIPVPIPQGLGSVTIEYRKFGTQLDFVPIVLGNGNIRLEVRPRVSELDNSIAITLGGSTIPGFRARQADTGVEMKAGQTMAIGGLIQSRTEASKEALPWVGDLPYVGAAFSNKRHLTNEIELLVLVRPELAEPLDPEEVPPCGPGLSTQSPGDCDFYWHGHLEVPKGTYDHCADGSCGMISNEQPVETVPVPTGPSPAARKPASTRAAAAPADPRMARGASARSGATTAARGASAPAATVRKNRQTAPSRQTRPDATASDAESSGPGLIGPVGYDLDKSRG